MAAQIVSLLVLIAAPWPLYRLLSIPPFRRWYRCLALRVLGLLAGYTAVVVTVWSFAPAYLPAAALAALLVLAAERIRSRSGYGTRHRLPPGRLGLVPRGPWVDEAFFRKQAARHGPIFKCSQFLRPMVCVIGARRGFALLGEAGDKLLPPVVRFSRFIPRGFIRYMQPEDHRVYRRILQTAISPQLVTSLGPRSGYAISRGIETMCRGAREAGPAGINPQTHIDELMLDVLVDAFLGIRHDSREFAVLRKLYRQVDIRKAACARPDAEIAAAKEIAAIAAKQAAILVNRGSHSGESNPSVLSAILARDPKLQFDETALLNLVYMIQIGRGDLTGLLMWTLKLLLENDHWLEALRHDAAGLAGSPDTLAQRVIKETLRLEQSEYLYRRARENVSFDGFEIPKGWLVRICIRDGHRDPRIFDEPDVFNPDRFEHRSFDREEYCPLGMFEHACLGGLLIDLVGAQFVSQLASDYDVSLASDGPPEYGRAHWQPSGRFRIRISRRVTGHSAR